MRWASPPERELFEADVAQEAQAIIHFLEDGPGDFRVEAAPGAPVAAQRNALEERQRIGYRKVDHVADALPVEQHRQALGPQPFAAARGARLLDHVLLELFAHAVGGGLPVAPLDVLEDPIPARLVLTVPTLAVVLKRERLSRRPGQDDLFYRCGQRLPRRVQVELERARQARQDHLAYVAARLAPRQDDPFQNRETRVAQHQIGAHLASGPESRAEIGR